MLTTIDDAENAPLDDEPVTDDELAAMREAEKRGEYSPLSEVRERLASFFVPGRL